jgi:hypothetical protein
MSMKTSLYGRITGVGGGAIDVETDEGELTIPATEEQEQWAGARIYQLARVDICLTICSGPEEKSENAGRDGGVDGAPASARAPSTRREGSERPEAPEPTVTCGGPPTPGMLTCEKPLDHARTGEDGFEHKMGGVTWSRYESGRRPSGIVGAESGIGASRTLAADGFASTDQNMSTMLHDDTT